MSNDSPALDDNSIGQTLEKERIALGWSQRDVSDQINLSVAVINSLEVGDYESLPPPTFIKGYIRSYAKLLELDPEPLVQAYGGYASPASNVIPTSESHHTTQNNTEEQNESSFNLSIVGILVIILLAMGIWLYNPLWVEKAWVELTNDEITVEDQNAQVIPPTNIDSESEGLPIESQNAIKLNSGTGVNEERPLNSISGSMSTDEESTVAEKNTFQNRNSEIEAPGDVEALTINLNNVGADEGLNATVGVVDTHVDPPLDEKTETTSDQSIPNEIDVEQVDQVKDVDNNQSAGDILVATDSFKIEQPAEGVPLPIDEIPTDSEKDILLIKAKETSWVSIIDARGKRLMYGMLTNGTPRKLQGHSPFNVVFGLAAGIELTLNGEAVDFTVLIRRSKTARFVIEPDGSTHR